VTCSSCRTRALREAWAQAEAAGDPALTARLLAVRGMNEADQGRHDAAVRLLARSAQTAASAGSRRQEAWSAGVIIGSTSSGSGPPAGRSRS